MQVYRWLSLFIVLVLTSSCGKPLPEWKDIDMNEWKSDKNGCSGTREKSLEILEKQMTTLEALDEMEIIEFLGKPDENELYKRNQKIYYYYLQPGSPCATAIVNAKTLTIRFNAMGLAKEIAIE